LSITALQQVIASLYKRKGKAVLAARDLELLASMELRWFEPADARKLVARATQLGLLEETTGGLKATFDIGSLKIPLGFKPPADLLSGLEENDESLFIRMVNQISLTTGLSAEKVIAEINDRQQKTEEYITLEVLALLYGKTKGVEMDRFGPIIKKQLIS
jgi:hypothetical protein